MESYSLIDKQQLEQYTCSICLEIFSNPYLISHCLHIFCLDCLNKFMDYFTAKYGKLECPNCRAPFKKEDLIYDPSILKHIDNFIIKCECKRKVRLVHYNLHIRSNCTEFYEMEDAEIKKLLQPPQKNQMVWYTCPCCQAKGFDIGLLASHVLNNHQIEEGICPICVLKNPGEEKSMLAFHMMEFHSENEQQNDENIDFLQGSPFFPGNNEDEELLKKAIEESLKK